MITRNKIAKLKELSENNTKALELASELLKTAQDRFGDTKHTFERDGKQVSVPESALWEEIWNLNELAVDAHRILGEHRSEVFEAFNKQKECAEELKAFTVLEIGVDHTKMTIMDYMQIIEDTVYMMVKELKEELKAEVIKEIKDGLK